jgi:putative membrane protein
MSRAAVDDTRPDQVQNVQIDALRALGTRQAIVVIISLSLAAVSFLVWLVYLKGATKEASPILLKLPGLNAVLNLLTSIFLILAYRAVRRRQYVKHMRLIFSAVATSALFFVSYIVYHYYHGDTHFLGRGVIRPIYFFILISHILLSAIAVPLILTSLYLALSGKLAMHRKVSRVTLPVWLYVSMTGPLIYLMLKTFKG